MFSNLVETNDAMSYRSFETALKLGDILVFLVYSTSGECCATKLDFMVYRLRVVHIKSALSCL